MSTHYLTIHLRLSTYIFAGYRCSTFHNFAFSVLNSSVFPHSCHRKSYQSQRSGETLDDFWNKCVLVNDFQLNPTGRHLAYRGTTPWWARYAPKPGIYAKYFAIALVLADGWKVGGCADGFASGYIRKWNIAFGRFRFRRVAILRRAHTHTPRKNVTINCDGLELPPPPSCKVRRRGSIALVRAPIILHKSRAFTEFARLAAPAQRRMQRLNTHTLCVCVCGEQRLLFPVRVFSGVFLYAIPWDCVARE